MSEVYPEYNSGLVSFVISMTDYRTLPHWGEFTKTKIRGVTRYDVPWDDIQPGDPLHMFQENGNIFFAYDGEIIGELKSARARNVKQLLSQGYHFKASVLKITGGTLDKPNHGCNIEIDVKNPAGLQPVIQDTDGKIHTRGI